MANAKRNEWIQTYIDLLDKHWELRGKLEKDRSQENLDLMDVLAKQLLAVRESYITTLVNSTISRCPYTGHLVTYDLDLQGLDGPWWHLDHPARKELDAPETFFALDGALKINDPSIVSPFPIAPGPDKPFVIPAILVNNEIKVVLSSTRIGQDTLWWMTYFTYPHLVDVARINLYGTENYRSPSPIGTPHVFSETYTEDDLDYDIEKWIRMGKLLWISPDDPALTLKAYTYDCPYLNIPGHGRYQYISSTGLKYLYGKDE